MSNVERLTCAHTPGLTPTDLSAIYGEQGENPYLEIMVKLSPEQARHLSLDLIEQAADRAEE